MIRRNRPDELELVPADAAPACDARTTVIVFGVSLARRSPLLADAPSSTWTARLPVYPWK